MKILKCFDGESKGGRRFVERNTEKEFVNQLRYKTSMSSGDKSGVRWRAASKEMMMQLEDRSSPGADCFSDNKCEARFNDTLPKSSITFV
ncbi:hypothetical protein TNCV_1333621 [Trichonephila clavipes]|nr:hypothetical protein TNCV_1333621 [Trichonephila clavipes]